MKKPSKFRWTFSLRSKEWKEHNGYYYHSGVTVHDVDPAVAYRKLLSLVSGHLDLFSGGELEAMKWRMGKGDDDSIAARHRIHAVVTELPPTLDLFLEAAEADYR